MKLAKLILGILFVLNFFLPSRSARADIAPPPAPQLGGLQPFSYQPTNVQMVDERVEIAIQSTDQDGRLQVTANFTMYNLGEAPEAMQVAFPLSSFANCRTIGNSYTHYRVSEDSFVATVTGVTVPIEKVITNHPYPECGQMTWAGFDVVFPVRENVIIQVSYQMQSTGVDFMQDLEYILETGAGWAGPIQHGDVIVKFPYPATSENVLPESTPGCQFRENEVVWSFDNLEPTSANNIHISLVSAHIWQEIVALRQELTGNPTLPETWLQLAQAYRDVSKTRKDHVRSDDYSQKAVAAYEQGLAANPTSAELYASYAGFKLHSVDPALSRQLTDAEAASVLALLNQAFALEPNNATAQTVLSELIRVAPFVTFTPPPMVTPASTPTTAVVPLAMEVDGVQKSQDSLSTAIVFGVLFLLVAGIGIDTFWLVKRKRK